MIFFAKGVDTMGDFVLYFSKRARARARRGVVEERREHKLFSMGKTTYARAENNI